MNHTRCSAEKTRQIFVCLET